jgi:hypothetical protein
VLNAAFNTLCLFSFVTLFVLGEGSDSSRVLFAAAMTAYVVFGPHERAVRR